MRLAAAVGSCGLLVLEGAWAMSAVDSSRLRTTAGLKRRPRSPERVQSITVDALEETVRASPGAPPMTRMDYAAVTLENPVRVFIEEQEEMRQRMNVNATEMMRAPQKPPPSAGEWVARVGVLLCALVYGTNFAEVKTLGAAMDPALSASLRFGLAAMGALPIVGHYYARTTAACAREEDRQKLVIGAMEIGAVNCLGYIAQAKGLASVDASLSAFLCSLAVVTVPILDAVVKGVKPSPATVAGAGLALLGVGLLSVGESADLGAMLDPAALSGLAFTLVQPLSFGFGFWRTENLLKEAADATGTTSSPLASAAVSLVAVKAGADIWLTSEYVSDAAAAARHPLSTTTLPIVPHDLPHTMGEVVAAAQHLPAALVVPILWTGLVTTFATVCVESMALSKISARETTVLFATEPLWGAAFAAYTLGEHLSPMALVGAGCILLACLTSSLLQPPALTTTTTTTSGPSL